MMVVLLGPPGSGKGTQADRLVAEFGFTRLSMGDLLRIAIQKNDKVGRQAKQYLAKGKLVPDSIVMEMVKREFAGAAHSDDFVLDGFPRNLAQAKALDKMLAQREGEIDLVLYFDAPFSILKRRLINRRVCPQCGAVYNLDTAPAENQDRCDRCDAKLSRREDDTDEVVHHRFAVYEQETLPIEEYYRKKGVLVTIDASGNEEMVWKYIREVINVTKKGVDEKQEHKS